MKKRKYKRKTKKREKISKILTVVLTACIFAIFAAIFIADGRYVRFDMADAAEIKIEYGQDFHDPGCRAVTVGRLFGESANELKVKSRGKVDTRRTGPQKITYVATFMLRRYSTERIVNVVDSDAPRITLEHKDGYAPDWFEGYIEEGYTAFDNADGDLTDKVRRKEDGNEITYTVTDSSGNTATAERLSVFGKTVPEIELVGGSEIEVYADDVFSDPGFSANDALGNDLSEYVRTEGDVTPDVPAEYHLRYYIENALGRIIEASRKVTVLPAAGPPQTEWPDEKTIYLTFDDGPGPYTDDLLDILAKYGVKATFFVTCANSRYSDCIGRAYREGHSVGAHTASHVYNQIYASEDAFFADMKMVQALIHEQTGEYTRLIRFPGGSSNTVSNFNPGIMTKLTQSVIKRGYQYFDWNVSSGDAGGTLTPSQVYENIISGCDGNTCSVVLQHDIKDFSVAAVEDVILWGRENGYTFKPLDIHSPAAHHRIAN